MRTVAFLVLLFLPSLAFAQSGTANGVYSTTPAPRLNQPYPLSLDANGNLLVSPSSTNSSGLTPVVSASAEATHVLKASAGNLYGAYAVNLTSTAGFLVIVNATSAPADGAITPLACVPLPANGIASINYNPSPPAIYSTGITAVITSASSCFTKTTGVITGYIGGAAR